MITSQHIEERWWTFCERMLRSSLTDTHYHDACIAWYIEQSCNGDEERFNDTSYYQADLFGINLSIEFLPDSEEESYMQHVYYEKQHEQDEYSSYGCFVETKDHVKPYHVHIHMHSDFPLNDKTLETVASFYITLDQVPSMACDISRIVHRLRRKQGRKHKDLFERALVYFTENVLYIPTSNKHV